MKKSAMSQPTFDIKQEVSYASLWAHGLVATSLTNRADGFYAEAL